MNFFGKRNLQPQSHSVKDQHVVGDQVITTHVSPMEAGRTLHLLNATGDGDQALYDKGLFTMTDSLDILFISHILDVDDVLHRVQPYTRIAKNRHDTHLSVVVPLKDQNLELKVTVNTPTGSVSSSANDRVKGFILGGSRGFNRNIPGLNVVEQPAPKRKVGRKPKVMG